MTGNLVIWGKGGHSKVIEQAIVEAFAAAPFWPGVDLREWYGPDAPPDVFGLPSILGFGDLAARRKLIGLLEGVDWVYIIHPKAIVTPDKIGTGTFVAAGAVVGVDAVVGPHCIINTNAVVDHDCVLGENVHVAPGAVLCGGVKVGRDVLIGANATVLPKVTIGDGAVIGAGVVVRRDVREGEVYRGTD